MGIYVNFWLFYDALSLNMAMSRDLRRKFQKILFFLILHLILRKVTTFLVEKLSTSEIISQKPHGGVENIPLPVLLGLNTRLFTWYVRRHSSKKIDTKKLPDKLSRCLREP